MFQFLHLEIVPDEIAVLTFDNANSKVNILSRAMWAEFQLTIYPLAAREAVRGLILRSAKPGNFIAGADLKELADADPARPEPTEKFIQAGNGVLLLLERMPFPTIALIDGAALGGGLEVALACDYRLCGTHPRLELGLPEIKLGLIPGWGGTQRLLRLMNSQLAMDRLLSGESFKAPDLPIGSLVDGVVASEQLLENAVRRIREAQEKAEWQAQREKKFHPAPFTPQPVEPTSAAMREMIRVVTEGNKLELQKGIALETEAFLKLAGSDESRRMIAEFFASRKK
jgi:enoyl-CoA hydratase/carnithine racemase